MFVDTWCTIIIVKYLDSELTSSWQLYELIISDNTQLSYYYKSQQGSTESFIHHTGSERQGMQCMHCQLLFGAPI